MTEKKPTKRTRKRARRGEPGAESTGEQPMRQAEVTPTTQEAASFRRISEKAYNLFEKRGKVHGHDWEDWFRAERMVLTEAGEARPKRG